MYGFLLQLEESEVINEIKRTFHWYLVLVARGSKLDSHVVIGTPGTTLDWVLKLRVFDPKKISVFVLDEADVMIDTQGHQDQTIRIYKYEILYSVNFDKIFF